MEAAADPIAVSREGIALEPPGSTEARLRTEAMSIDHLATHVPTNPYSSACLRAKTIARPHHSGGRPDSLGPLPGEFWR